VNIYCRASECRQFKRFQMFVPRFPSFRVTKLKSLPATWHLFEECYRQGVLTSEFFLNNKRFLGKIPLKPDATLRTAFFEAVTGPSNC
jgi:hypothetical protein